MLPHLVTGPVSWTSFYFSAQLPAHSPRGSGVAVNSLGKMRKEKLAAVRVSWWSLLCPKKWVDLVLLFWWFFFCLTKRPFGDYFIYVSWVLFCARSNELKLYSWMRYAFVPMFYRYIWRGLAPWLSRTYVCFPWAPCRRGLSQSALQEACLGVFFCFIIIIIIIIIIYYYFVSDVLIS